MQGMQGFPQYNQVMNSRTLHGISYLRTSYWKY